MGLRKSCLEEHIVTSESPEQLDSQAGEDGPRPPRPAIRQGLTVTEYTQGQLAELAIWVLSDGIPRTDEELLTELFHEIGHLRRGIRMEAYLRIAISMARKHDAAERNESPRREQ